MFLVFKVLLRMAMFVSELLEVLSWNELELLMQSTRGNFSVFAEGRRGALPKAKLTLVGRRPKRCRA